VLTRPRCLAFVDSEYHQDSKVSRPRPQSNSANTWRVASIPGYFQTTNEGAPGPSHSGTWDATDLNPEPVRDVPANPLQVGSKY